MTDERGEVWIDATTAALILGYSPQYLGRLALAERLPGRRTGTGARAPWRFRRRDIEQAAAARALQQLLDDHHHLPAGAEPKIRR